MSKLTELLAQKAEIDRQISQFQNEERAAAVVKVKTLMAEYGLSLADLGTRSASLPRSTTAKKVAAKYRDTTTGESWSGRGLKPKWLKAAVDMGRSIDEFKV